MNGMTQDSSNYYNLPLTQSFEDGFTRNEVGFGRLGCIQSSFINPIENRFRMDMEEFCGFFDGEKPVWICFGIDHAVISF